jgi:hypothetical protein
LRLLWFVVSVCVAHAAKVAPRGLVCLARFAYDT